VAIEPEPILLPPPEPVEIKAAEPEVVEVDQPEIDEEVEEINDEVAELELPPESLVTEVEYWWDDAPGETNHNSKSESDSPNGWLPEPVIHPHRW
jgi:hypothetical protein